ncbi:MAG: bifunctional (p)ppGpp synthetase/guanosine-3',5'-bis(diphosphate) 3'-pyrophosphohydrolase [Alphaproteobacteria bacterium]|nr:bifunctional (p)ppGpp synthetase/guanosine-3',5'-bis(diphosphate) 3'-pyrophosphohydrolase [Alphaproteobacteria bacterium]
MLTKEELIAQVRQYDGNADVNNIGRAYDFALECHKGQLRESTLEPYFTHPVGVAQILAEYRLDSVCIIAALLHDTVEDCKASVQQIRLEFGWLVADIVDGLTKLSVFDESVARHSRQAENFRKLVLATSKDIRVLLVKLADRLHNMRQLKNVAEEKRRRVAKETSDIYSKLAERIGLARMHSEFEEIAFETLHPEICQSIKARLDTITNRDGGLVRRIVVQLKEDLADQDVAAEISGRVKSAYSVWHKMQRKNSSFEQLGDVVAFRIIVDSVKDCYHALGVVHTRYQMVPSEYDDYISTPKPNGYKSIHTYVIGPEKQRIEVQIRTREMHHQNEYGAASHWVYKQGGSGQENFKWLRELIDLMAQSKDSDEFMEATKLEMYKDQVFCFTPKGELITLPVGATPIDFAYAVHSGVGNRCIGAKINGAMRPLRTTLQNGDQVEIMTGKAANPSAEWERLAVTAKAKAAVRRFLREHEREKNIDIGRTALFNRIKLLGEEPSDRVVEAGLQKIKYTKIEDVYVDIAIGGRSSEDIANLLFPRHGKVLGRIADALGLGSSRRRQKKAPKQDDGKKKSPILGLIAGMKFSYARCCHPVPGDSIVGVINTGRGITIHNTECKQLAVYAGTPERLMTIDWDPSCAGGQSTARLKLCMSNAPGTLGMLSVEIARSGGNISNLIVLDKSSAYIDMLVDVEVKDTSHLQNVIAALRSSSLTASVDRVLDQ